RHYFETFWLQSITSQQFEEYLQHHLLNLNPQAASRVDVHAWIHEPGLPPHPVPTSKRFEAVDEVGQLYSHGQIAAADVGTETWCTHEWVRFLRSLKEISVDRMYELDNAFHLSDRENAEILFEWLRISIRFGYRIAYPHLDYFLSTIGRRKFVLD